MSASRKHSRYGNPKTRQAHQENRVHHARTYLLTWDEYAAQPLGTSVVSDYMIVHSMFEVTNAYGWIHERQFKTTPAGYADLPMPRVFAIDGAIRELPESGYDLIEPKDNVIYMNPRDGYGRTA